MDRRDSLHTDQAQLPLSLLIIKMLCIPHYPCGLCWSFSSSSLFYLSTSRSGHNQITLTHPTFSNPHPAAVPRDGRGRDSNPGPSRSRWSGAEPIAAELRGGSPAHGPHRAVTMATAALPAGPRGRRGEGAGPAPGRDIPASRRPPAALPPPSRSPSLRGSAEGRPLARPASGRARPPLAARRRRGGKAAARPTSLQATSPVRRNRRPVLRRQRPAVWLGECCRRGHGEGRWDKGGQCWLTLRAGTGSLSPLPRGVLRPPRRLRWNGAPVPWGALLLPHGPSPCCRTSSLLPSRCVRAKGSCPRVWKRGESPLPKKPRSVVLIQLLEVGRGCKVVFGGWWCLLVVLRIRA